jgi:hypothetical protein
MRKTAIFLFLALLLTVPFCSAQRNEFSVSIGGTIPSGATGSRFCQALSIINCPPGGTQVNTNTAISYEGAYAYRLMDFKAASLHVELPLLGIPTRRIDNPLSVRISQSSIFLTPSLKLKLFPSGGISPFASVGVGFAHFGGSSIGNSLNNTTAAGQIGGGLDFKTGIPFLGFRAEVRDFITGRPKLEQVFSLNSDSNHQHNVFIGGGVVLHF